jgi:hypothetical protein
MRVSLRPATCAVTRTDLYEDSVRSSARHRRGELTTKGVRFAAEGARMTRAVAPGRYV